MIISAQYLPDVKTPFSPSEESIRVVYHPGSDRVEFRLTMQEASELAQELIRAVVTAGLDGR